MKAEFHTIPIAQIITALREAGIIKAGQETRQIPATPDQPTRIENPQHRVNPSSVRRTRPARKR